jgi:hypothetical protein
MTVCIAAICKENNEERIVFATDHMISTNMGQFEHSIDKYKIVNQQTVAMIAGDALLFDFLLDLECYDSEFDLLRKAISTRFKEKRKELIQNNVLDVFGVGEDFVINALNSPQYNPFVESILRSIAELKLNTAILLVGIDDGKAKISEISDGQNLDYRSINFHAIGSGHMQAVNTLLFQRHSKEDNLATTVYNVYKAKKNAEVSNGVGKETEIAVLGESVKPLSEEDISTLQNIYEYELKCGKEHDDLKELDL